MSRPSLSAPGGRFFDFGFGSGRIEPQRQQSFHRHNEVELILVERGAIGHLVGGRRTELHPGRLAVFWGAVPHAPLEIEPSTVVHRLTLPLTWFLEWNLPATFTSAILAGETIMEPDPGTGPGDLAMLSRWHIDLEEGSSERKKLVLLECEARLRRLILSVAPAGKQLPRPAPSAPSKIERMTRYVAGHYTETIRLADIGKAAGLNPDYAATLFRKTFGRSLVDYVNGHRVSHAQRLLATTDAKIVDIAFLTGFGSASRFYTAFKQVCGRTPRDYRMGMGLASPPKCTRP